MTWFQSVILALLQGVTELFPVSSLGHTVIVAGLFGWGALESSPNFVPYLVLFHLGTATALFGYFWRDWLAILRALVVTGVAGRIEADTNGRVAWLLVAGTIPAGLVGLFLQNALKQLFGSPIVAATFLAINGVILILGERARRGSLAAETPSSARMTRVAATRRAVGTERPVVTPNRLDQPSTLRSFDSLSVRSAVLVGLAQALALIPGISRSGVTMVAGLGAGMDHEDAAAYTFLLATPIIGAAALLEVPPLFGSPGSVLLIAVVGGVIAGVAAYLSVRFLMRYFEGGRLDPFGYYCVVAGLVALAYFVIRG